MLETQSWNKNIIIKGPVKEHYCDIVIDMLEKIKKTKLGNPIIKTIMRKSLIIDYTNLESSLHLTHLGLKILYNHRQSVPDPTFDTITKNQAVHTYLYHELVHAARWLTGKFIEYKHNDWQNPKLSIREEYTVTGLYEYSGYHYSENEYRRLLDLPRRPYYFCDPTSEQYEEEIKRRTYLSLPDPPKYRDEELVFTKNTYNQQINNRKIRRYIAIDYERKRKELLQKN